MNWLDIVCIVLIIAGFIKGYKDGFIRQVVFFLALIAAIYLCSQVALGTREYVIQAGWFREPVVTLLSYILAFIMIAGIITLAGWIIHKMISVTPLSLLNHLAGSLLGLIVTVLLLSLTLNVVEGLDRRSALISRETKVESQFYFYLKDIVPAIYPIDLFIWNEEVEE
jgi:membrane protein required for colicin V production